MNATDVKIENLKRQVYMLFERLRSVENCIKIADDNDCGNSVSGGSHVEHLEKVIAALKSERDENKCHIENLVASIASLKAERDQQFKCIEELKERCGKQTQEIIRLQQDPNGLWIQIKDEYQKGHSDGYAEALAKVQEHVLKIRE